MQFTSYSTLFVRERSQIIWSSWNTNYEYHIKWDNFISYFKTMQRKQLNLQLVSVF